MMQVVAFFALLAGASALESVDILVKTSELLEKKLASFEKKDLKDVEVYEDYVKVREEAKKAAAALEAAEKEAKAFTPVQVLDPQVQRLALDLEEADNIEESKVEAQTDKLKQQAEEAEEEDRIEKIYEEKAEDTEETDQKEVEEKPVEEKTEEKKVDKKTLKTRNLIKKQATSKEELEAAKAANLKNFQSPYRAASKKEQAPTEVLDEGTGHYGKFSKIILESFAQQDGPLEDTIAKREKELAQEAIIHQKAIKLARKAEDMCGTDSHCKEVVNKKLANGGFDRELKEKKAPARDLKAKSKK